MPFSVDAAITSRFASLNNLQGGNIDLHAVIDKLPRPKTLPDHKYTGPYNPLDENDNPMPGQEPYNQVHAIAMRICYRGRAHDKRECDMRAK